MIAEKLYIFKIKNKNGGKGGGKEMGNCAMEELNLQNQREEIKINS